MRQFSDVIILMSHAAQCMWENTRYSILNTRYKSSDTRYSILNTRYHQTKSAGFSLVEVLVGAAVLIISVTGTLSLIAKNVSSAAIAAERVTAFYLAQEALEYVRGVRDNNAITGASGGWLDGLDGVGDSPDCFSSDGCVIDVNARTPCVKVVECGALGCEKLHLRVSDGVYNQCDTDPETETKFTRKMTLQTISSDEVQVNATVSWPQGLVERSFTISGHLFNWR